MDYLALLTPSLSGWILVPFHPDLTIYMAPEEGEEEAPDLPWGGEKLEGTAQRLPLPTPVLLWLPLHW